MKQYVTTIQTKCKNPTYVDTPFNSTGNKGKQVEQKCWGDCNDSRKNTKTGEKIKEQENQKKCRLIYQKREPTRKGRSKSRSKVLIFSLSSYPFLEV